MAINKGYRQAKKRLSRLGWIAEKIDRVLTKASMPLRMCGEGKRNNWSVMVSRVFYTECTCCLFWRGVTAGAFIAAAIAALVAATIFIFF